MNKVEIKVIKQEKIRVRNKATEVDRLCASNLKAKKLQNKIKRRS